MTKCALCALFVSITVCLRSPDVTGLLEEVSQERLQNEEETRKQFRLHLQKQTEQKEKLFLFLLFPMVLLLQFSANCTLLVMNVQNCIPAKDRPSSFYFRVSRFVVEGIFEDEKK